jgi:hypothetical protein
VRTTRVYLSSRKSAKDNLRNTIKELSLNEPSGQEVMKVLKEYKMFSSAELTKFEKEIVS